MSFLSVRTFLAERAPDLSIIDLDRNSSTYSLADAWGIRPAQIAKSLVLSASGPLVLAVVCGDARLDNRKIKRVLGGKFTMATSADVEALTGHPVGGVCPLGLATPLPVYVDIRLRPFDEVVSGAGSPRHAIRIPPDRLAELAGAQWADLCCDS